MVIRSEEHIYNIAIRTKEYVHNTMLLWQKKTINDKEQI